MNKMTPIKISLKDLEKQYKLNKKLLDLATDEMTLAEHDLACKQQKVKELRYAQLRIVDDMDILK